MAASPAQDVDSDQHVRVPLTAELLVRRYVEQGIAAYQIAAETGWSDHCVRARLRAHGIAVRPPGTVKSYPLDRDALAALLGQGLTVREIAEAADYSPRGIYVLLRRWQLSVQATSKPVPTEELETVARLYRDEQRSLTDVGAAFGHGAEWARARVLAAGLAVRHQSVRPAGGYPELDASELARGYAEGLTVRELADRTGRSREAVSRVLRAAGVEVRARARVGISVPDPERVRELYVEGHLTLAQTGRQLGCSARRVAAVLKAAGVELRPAARPATAPPLAPLDADQLHELYVTQQLTQQEIADRLGCSDFRIATALTRFGIPRRPRAERRPVPIFELDASIMHQLYVTERLSDKSIADRYGVPAWRVTVRRRELRVHRPPATPPPRTPAPPAADVLRRLYLEEHTPIAVIAHRFGTSTPTARAWLQDADIPIQPRTSRAHRVLLDPAVLRELYTDREWTAEEIAAELDTTQHKVLRGLHENAIPVRRGGSRRTQRLPGETPTTRLLAALYADRQVGAALRRHGVPRRPETGSIADRFPTAIGLTKALLVELYEGVGLSARQIELLTGQPHEQILDALHAHHIEVRRDFGRSPWLARQP